MCTFTAIIAAAIIGSLDPASIHARNSSPIAPRGGVLMVPLLSEQRSADWPSTLAVTLSDGRRIIGHIGWIEAGSPSTAWTGGSAVIRPVEAGDDTALLDPQDSASGPVLLAQLPLNGHGPLSLGGDTLEAQWVDLPSHLPNLGMMHPLAGDLTEAAEPPATPLHWWRAVLLANRHGLNVPPPPNNSDVELLAAVHMDQLWRVALHRLANMSRGVAAQCRDILTATASDNEYLFGCWAVDGVHVEKLLATLLDTALPQESVVRYALQWCEASPSGLAWAEQAFGRDVAVAIANPSPRHVLVSWQWEENNDVPLATDIPAGGTARNTVERPQLIDPSLFGPVTTTSVLQRLTLNIGGQRLSLPFTPAVIEAKPPSVALPLLHPTWTLLDLRRGRPALPAIPTSVEIRKVMGRWEVFAACTYPGTETPLPGLLADLGMLAGTEAFTIVCTRDGSPCAELDDTVAVLSITPQGHRLYRGVDDGSLEVHQRATASQWRVRVVLPPTWMPDSTLRIAFLRSHGDSSDIETGPLPCVPWNVVPAPAIITLDAWNRIERVPITTPH